MIVSPIASRLAVGISAPMSGLQFRPLFAPDILSLQLQRGTGSPSSDIRASTASVRVWNGPNSAYFRTAQADEHRVQGARRVENLLQWSEDFGNAAWTKNGATAASGATIHFGGAGSDHRIAQTAGGVLQPNRANATIRCLLGVPPAPFWSDPSAKVELWPGGSSTQRAEISPANDWQWISAAITYSPGESSQSTSVTLATDRPVSITGLKVQCQIVTGQTNQAPGEYIKTEAARRAIYLDHANPQTVNAQGLVNLAGAPATPLHPSRLIDGMKWYDTYPARANNTAYTLGQLRHWGGYYAAVTQAGTSGSSAPSVSSIGQTLTDGTVQWQVLGYYDAGFGLLVEGSATNLALQSAMVSSSATEWLQSEHFSSITAVNSVFPGQSAWRHTAETIANRNRRQNIGTLSGSTETLSFIVENVNAATTVIGLRNEQDNAWPIRASFDWATAAVAIIDGAGAASAQKLADVGPNGGAVYRIIISGTGTAGRTRGIRIYPSGLGDDTRAAIIHHVQLDLSPVASTPVITTTAAVTRASEAGNIRWPIAGTFDNAQGMAILDFIPGYGHAGFGVGVARGLVAVQNDLLSLFGVRATAATEDMQFWSRTGDSLFQNNVAPEPGSTQLVAHRPYRLAVRWGGGTFQIGRLRPSVSGGVWEWRDERAYTGYELGAFIRLFVGNNFPNILRNLALYDRDRGRSWIESRFP